LVVGCWLLLVVVGCWLLVVGWVGILWLVVVGCWLGRDSLVGEQRTNNKEQRTNNK
jgi:hypothetical protein